MVLDDLMTSREPLAHRFLLERPLAEGGMGALYVAVQQPLGRRVALKLIRPGVLDEGALRRFEREARALAQLRHRHIVTVYDYGHAEEGPFLAMELLEGPTLRERIKGEGRFAERDALGLVAAVARGLLAAHRAGIVHRDLKPANIILAREPEEEVVKLLDFGLAARTHKDLGGGAPTQSDHSGLVGTPGYIAPERALLGVEGDPRSDLYSLGVIAFECLTGSSPFRGITGVALVMAHATEPAPRLRDRVGELEVSDGTEQLVDDLLAKDPARRPADAAAVVERCEELLERLGPRSAPVVGLAPSMVTERSSVTPIATETAVELPPPPAALHPAPPVGRGRLAAAGLVVALLVVSAMAGVQLLGDAPVHGPMKAPRSLLSRRAPVFAAALDRAGERVAFTERESLVLLHWPTGETRQVDSGPLYSNASLAFLDDENVLVAGAPNLSRGAPLTRVALSTGAREVLLDDASGVAVAPDGAHIAWGAEEGVYVGRPDGSEPRVLARQPLVRPVCFSPSSDSVLVADYRNASLQSVPLDGGRGAVWFQSPKLRLSSGEIIAAWPERDVVLYGERERERYETTVLVRRLVDAGSGPPGPDEALHTLRDQTLSASSWAPPGRWLLASTRARNEVQVAAYGPALRLEPISLSNQRATPIAWLDETSLLVRTQEDTSPSRYYAFDVVEQRGTYLDHPRLVVLGVVESRALVAERRDDELLGLLLWSKDAPRVFEPILTEDGAPLTLPGRWTVDCPSKAPGPCVATEPRADFVRLFLLDPTRGWTLEPLDSSIGGEPAPRISPDGKLVAIPVEQGFRLLDIATRRERTVTVDSELTGDWIQVSFAPDGQSVVGSVLGHGGSANFVVESDLAGRTRILWRSTDEVVFEVLRSPEGARVAVRKKSFASELLLFDVAR